MHPLHRTRDRIRLTLALLLACAIAAACGTSSQSRDYWAYLGRDPALVIPKPVTGGDMSPQARFKLAQDDLAAWKIRVRAAVDDTKRECTRLTGESPVPEPWTGYSKSFATCMEVQGWQRTLTSDPR